jgi:signal transduction histidine kinase
VALVAGAWWLRDPGIPYVAVASAATVLAVLSVPRLSAAARRWAIGAAGTLAIFCALAFVAQRDLRRIDTDWPGYRTTLLSHGEDELQRALNKTIDALRTSAARALDASALSEARTFDALARSVGNDATRGVVLYRRGQPVAWGGTLVVSTDSLTRPLGTASSPFYLVLYATAERGDARAVATAVVWADPPGDRLTHGVGNRVARRVGLHAFEISEPVQVGAVQSAWLAYATGSDTLLLARPIPPGPEEARLIALERVRTVGAILAGAALILLLITAWRLVRSLAWRLVPLAVALLVVALVPLNAFSSLSVLFDPTVYYAELGGPLTASIGALGAAAAIVLLALLLVLRARARKLSRGVALPLMVAIVAGGPFLMRALSRGVAPPVGGLTDSLWLAWEISLFLAACALLAGAAVLGSIVLGRARGVQPVLAPALAALAALLGPVIMDAPAAWPAWYTALWIAAIGALALSRRHERVVLAAATVAAFGAATLTWSAGVRGRIALANRDVAALGSVQQDVVAALQRLADVMDDGDGPRTQADLARLYMRSDLVGSGYPVVLQSWSAGGVPVAEVALDSIAVPDATVRQLVAEAQQTREGVLRAVPGTPGMLAVLAMPYPDGTSATVVVAPRTRLIPADPFNSLLGLEPRERGQPPYAISLLEMDPTVHLAPGATSWYWSGGDLHGDRIVETASGPMRAHIEVNLLSLPALVQRGTLVVLLDLVLIAALWVLSVLPEGGLGRWVRARASRWARSYRARLTVALFAFFVLPAFAFALWSYGRLQSEDRQSRELIVRESLRAASATAPPAGATTGARNGAPLLVYLRGELRGASEPLFAQLAPTGVYLPPRAYMSLSVGRESYESQLVPVGGTRTLFGYLATPAWGERDVVVASPARGSEEILDLRRRDLGVMVMFVTVLGALSALWLSRIASRSLAHPIRSLRGAALAIAGGEREPPLAGQPPEEFEPVFSAFRRMAADLGASRAALESAQRRTTAVLRNVATGVVALAPDGSVMLANPRAAALLGSALAPGAPIEEAGVVIAEHVRAFLSRDADEVDFEAELAGRRLQARLTRLTASVAGGGGAVLTVDDVTELLRAQRVLAWGEMARQVAHEIKNPLTPIRLGVQHLKRAHADARGDFDQILDRNVQRILAEIDRLDEIARSFSRYGTAPAERLAAEPVDVAAIARDVVELERLGRGEIDWRLTGADAPLFALARADELREVLLNLLENARLASSRTIEIHCAARDGRVLLEVSDDGHGIPPDLLPRLFEPHFSTRTSGSGLGLAISRQLIESWGGQIAIASREGEGTRVRMELRT